jgi:hypothetical protein
MQDVPALTPPDGQDLTPMHSQTGSYQIPRPDTTGNSVMGVFQLSNTSDHPQMLFVTPASIAGVTLND